MRHVIISSVLYLVYEVGIPYPADDCRSIYSSSPGACVVMKRGGGLGGWVGGRGVLPLNKS